MGADQKPSSRTISKKFHMTDEYYSVDFISRITSSRKDIWILNEVRMKKKYFSVLTHVYRLNSPKALKTKIFSHYSIFRLAIINEEK